MAKNWRYHRRTRRAPKYRRPPSEYTTAIRRPGFSDFANDAYAADRGYAIRTNPYTGRNEMFVAGSRNRNDWLANLAETAYYNAPKILPWHLRPIARIAINQLPTPFGYRRRYAHDLEQIARDNDVQTIYGHSRGAGIVSDIQGPFDRVGLDGAMIIAKDRNRDMFNIAAQGQMPDQILASAGRNNTYIPTSRFHKVY